MTKETSPHLQEALRGLPPVHEALAEPSIRAAAAGLPEGVLVELVRQTIEENRRAILSAFAEGNGSAPETDRAAILQQCRERLATLSAPALVPAINATGIIAHTGLGRAPLAAAAREAIDRVAAGYCDVAISRASGARRARSTIVEPLLKALTGAEAALVVNNNAAAVLLALHTHARDREVIVSRGQLVEIGGSFRLPDVMASAGARLREVGTTNRTRLADYEAAIGDATAALMRMHPSNYRIVGFTESVELAELAGLARRRGLLLIDDIGSGALIDFSPFGLKGEPLVRESLAAGADLVLMSADKLLGGPQAGLILGRRAPVEACARHPLMRALRVDKLTLAALEATLRLYLEPAGLAERLPLLRMIAEPEREARRRARRLLGRLRRACPGVMAELRRDVAYVGGGSLPEQGLPTWVIALPNPPGGAEGFKRRLRLADPPVFARARRDQVELDLRTVSNGELSALAGVLLKLLAPGGATA